MNNGFILSLSSYNSSSSIIQSKLLVERLKSQGYDAIAIDLSDQKESSAYFINRYKNKEYMRHESLSPYVIGLMFALNRFDQVDKLQQILEQNKIIVLTGNASQTMIDQIPNFGKQEERRGYCVWYDNLEYELLGCIRPSLGILLSSKNKQSESEELIASLFPKDHMLVNTIDEGIKLSIATINNKIWQILEKFIPEPSITSKPFTPNESKIKSPELGLKTSLLLASRLINQAGIEARVDTTGIYIPENLNKINKLTYLEGLTEIFKFRLNIINKLKDYIILNPQHKQNAEQIVAGLLPLAIKTEIINIESLIIDKFMTNVSVAKLVEAKSTLNRLNINIPKKYKVEQYSKNIESSVLTSELLLKSNPKNELDLLNILEPNNQPPKTINKKYWKLKELLKLKKDALNQVNYSLRLYLGTDTILELIDRGIIENLRFMATDIPDKPSTPELIVQLGLELDYNECLRSSQKYSNILQNNDEKENARYLELVVNRQVVEFDVNANQIRKLLLLKFEGYFSLKSSDVISRILDLISEVHPTVHEELIS